MLRQGDRPPPKISCPKQLYSTNVKQKYFSLQENRADPRHRQSRQMPWAGRCWGGWVGYGSLLTITVSEPWKISLLRCCYPGEAEGWRPLLCASTPIKIQTLCSAIAIPLVNIKTASWFPQDISQLLIHLHPLSSVPPLPLAGVTQGRSKPEPPF